MPILNSDFIAAMIIHIFSEITIHSYKKHLPTEGILSQGSEDSVGAGLERTSSGVIVLQIVAQLETQKVCHRISM